MTKQTYIQFRAAYKAALKGQPFKMVDLNRKWKEYQKQKEPKEEKKEQEQPKEPKEKISIEIAPQEPIILAQKKEEPQPAAEQKATESKAEPQVVQPVSDELYTQLADAMHQTAANIVRIFTSGAVVVSADQVQRLNVCGAHILKKYDPNGVVMQYSPEAAYILTLADIGTQVYLQMKKKDQPKEEKPAQTQQHASAQQQDKSFSKLLQKV